MSTLEASITIDLPDNVDAERYIQLIRTVISNATGKDTELHITEMDNPITTSPIGPR